MVAAASSVDDSVPGIADAALCSFVVVGVERAFREIDAFAVHDGVAVGAHALSVDVGGSHWAEGLAVAVVQFVAGLAEATVGVGVVVLAWVAVGADSSDSDVLGLADAGLGGC